MAKVKQRTKFELWVSVIFALLLRHIQSKFSDKLGLAWLVAQPVIFIVALGTLRGRLEGGEVHGLPPFVFMLLGFVTVLQFIQGWTSVSNSMRKDRPLYAFRQVQPISSVVATAVLEFVTFILIMLVLSYIAVLMGNETEVDDPLFLIIYMIEIQILSYGLGMVFGIFKFYIKQLKELESMLRRPLIFISGTFFSLNDMPKEAWPYLDWNPLLHGIELSRNAVNSGFPLASTISPLYLHISTLTMVFMGLSIYFVLWKKAISR